MSEPLRTCSAWSGLSRLPLYLAMILVLIAGTTSIAFEVHAFRPTVEASISHPTSVEQGGLATGERSCGHHPACIMALLPTTQAVAPDRCANTQPRPADGTGHSLCEPTPDHPPIIS